MNFKCILKKFVTEVIHLFNPFYKSKQGISLLFLFFVHIIANSQERNDSLHVTKKVSEYIVHHDTIISVRLNANSEIDFFEVNGDDFFYDIRPNISISNNISLNYRFISLSFGFTPKFIPGNNDNDIEGATKAFSFGLTLHPKHWLQEVKYTKIKGFYLHNTEDYKPGWTQGKDPYILFPDLSVQFFRGSTGYKFNPNFSLNAINSLTERQVKSAGSFIPFLNYDYYIIDNKSKNTAQQSSQKTNNFSMVASVGYMYTLVLSSKFYTSLGFFPGGGFEYTKLLTRMPEGNIETKNTNPVWRYAVKAAIGYNSEKFFTGAEVSITQATRRQGTSSVQNKASRAYFNVFVGYRFKAPEFIKRETDMIKKHSFGIIKE